LQLAQQAGARLQLELKDVPQPLEGRVHRFVERSFRVNAMNNVYRVVCHVVIYPRLMFLIIPLLEPLPP
jgi:hypothetical protein